MKDKFFCIAPWVHSYIHPTGKVQTCCVGMDEVGNCKNNTLQEIWNSDNLKKYRLDFLQGVKNENCKTCINAENNNIHSLRESLNGLFAEEIESLVGSTNIDGSLDEFKLRYIDVRFSNFCNFKCRPCYEEYSSSIKLENLQESGKTESIVIYPGKDEDDLLDQIIPHLKYVKKLYFAGGEPLIQREHWEILQELLALGKTDVELFYNTNLSTTKYKDKNIFQYWQHFKNVKVNASLDGWKEQAEYWRSGTKWDVIEKNVKEIKEKTPHVCLGTTTTIGWPNLWNALDFIDHCIETDFIDPNQIYINVLQVPTVYCLTTLPDFKKTLAKTRILETLSKIEKASTMYKDKSDLCNNLLYSNLNGAIALMEEKSTESFMQHFDLINGKLDRIRNENFFDVFPEHADLKKFIYEK